MIFDCPYCDDWFATKQPLSVHINSKHKEWKNGKLTLVVSQ